MSSSSSTPTATAPPADAAGGKKSDCKKSDAQLYTEVRDYYSKDVKTSDDLKTNACVDAAAVPDFVKPALSRVHDDIHARYYGCGLTVPDGGPLDGLTVLDLGCGTGRDVYMLATLVGEHGSVIGVDMTDEQLDVARRYEEHHREANGYARSNVRFVKGTIEDLRAAGIEDNSVDVIVSNCVVNLSPAKHAVLAEAHRVLRPGGEMYFSDVYADRRVPRALRDDRVLWGECISGALYYNDFLREARRAGFVDPRLVKSRPFLVTNPRIAKHVARFGVEFSSATYRLFKLDAHTQLEPSCEDYGQAVCFAPADDDREATAQCSHALTLDAHHTFVRGRWTPVCGNTYSMLAHTRYARWFKLAGSTDTHYGVWPTCGSSRPTFPSDAGAASGAAATGGGGGCC